ncbi:hypothetical protein CRG98_019920, partial [Punica granatum]
MNVIGLGVKPTSLGRKDFVMRIVGTMMGLKHTSSEVGFVKRELMHKISEAYMFRVDQSHERSPNSSKSRVIYLASGYEERVGEVFESRVTPLNAWKDARVQRMHVWGARCTGNAAGMHGRRAACAKHGQARGRARACACARAGALACAWAALA